MNGFSRFPTFSCALALLFVLPASAQDARKLEEAKAFKQKKIAFFFNKTAARTDLDAATKAKIMELQKGALLGGEYGCIHQSLLLSNADYKRADALLLGERYAAAADLFQRVAASDEYYLRAGLPFPGAESYDDVDLHEDGIGMATTFGREFRGEIDDATSTASGLSEQVSAGRTTCSGGM